MVSLMFQDSETVNALHHKMTSEGYIRACFKMLPNDEPTMTHRLNSIEYEAFAAQLINRYKTIIGIDAYMVLSEGEPYFILDKEQYPFGEFYIKPNMLTALLAYLDQHPEAIKARAEWHLL